MNFEDIIRSIEEKKWHPVYFLTGDENYFIDRICRLLADGVVPEEQWDFNRHILYGKEVSGDQLVALAGQMPMMGTHQLLMVREAQEMKDIDRLAGYLKSPLDSTVLVLAYKNKKADGRKEITKLLKKHAVYFEGKKLYEERIPDWAIKRCRSESYILEQGAALLLADSVGTDLSRLNSELEKLFIALPENSRIDADSVSRLVGISRTFNNFELKSAIAKGDHAKAQRIVAHFAANPGKFPPVLTFGTLYDFFARLLLYHKVDNKDPRNVAQKIGVNPYFIREFSEASRRFSIRTIVRNIELLRTYDMRSKGVGAAAAAPGELLRELVFRLMH